jgi:type VI secretion system protein ImpI
MGLTLRIENESNLPDGGPLSVSVSGKRGIDIGRDTHLDWTLPDSSRYISGKHCEVRYSEGGYWLYDVSTNGTFLYGSEGRLKGPHRLRNGDRLQIGHYIVAVSVDGEEAAPAAQAAPTAGPAGYHELWNSSSDAAPPVDPSQVRAPREHPAPVRPDFLDWAIDVPDPVTPPRAAPRPPAAPAAPATNDFDWAYSAPKPAPPVEPPPEVPSPRRPTWVSNEPDGPWGAPAAPPAAEEPPPMPAAPAPPPAAAAAPAEAPPAPAPPSFAAAPPSFAPAPPSVAPPPSFAPAEGGQPALARGLARGAHVPEDVFAQRDPDQLAEQLGGLMLLVVENVRQLLNARGQAKRLARSANQTMIQALNNNPLKFSPTSEDALRIMFGPPTRSYLDAHRSLEQSFDDLKTHQLKTYSAMQQALRMLVADLDPQAISAETEEDRGIASLMGSRKAKLWDIYVARWQAKARRHEGGMIDVFMQYFAECYDRGGPETP